MTKRTNLILLGFQGVYSVIREKVLLTMKTICEA